MAAPLYFSKMALFAQYADYPIIPRILIPIRPTDLYDVYTTGVSQLDKLSERYYGNSLMGWLILEANPQYTEEPQINNQDIIRIPFPFDIVKSGYLLAVTDWMNLNPPSTI